MTVRAWPVVCMAAMLAACGGGAPSSAAESGSDGSDPDAGAMPPVFVDQTRWEVDHGKPVREQSYHHMLQICRENTPGETVALPDKDVHRLGRIRTRAWYQGTRYAVIEESWDFDVDGSGCRFSLRHARTETLHDGSGQDYQLDLLAGSGEHMEALADSVSAMLAPSEANIADAEATGLKFEGHEKVAGQSCLAWSDTAGNRACLWTGGEPWGFASLGPAEASGTDGRFQEGIALRAQPAEDGSGWRVRTERMTVGKAPDSNVFSVPSGITVRDGDPD